MTTNTIAQIFLPLMFNLFTQAKDPQISIAMIPKGTTQHFWKSIQLGAENAAKEEGIQLLWEGPQKDNDRTAQIQVVQNMISRQVQGIALIPSDAQALVPVVRQAGRRKIPVILVNSGLEGNDYLSFVGTDNVKAGELGAETMIKLLKDQGDVAVLRYFEGSRSTDEREVGFIDYLKKNKNSLKMVSGNQFAGIGMENAYQKAQTILQAHPNLKGIFCVVESVCHGILRAIEQAGKKGKITVVGFDASELNRKALMSGEIAALVLQSPYNQGYLGVKTMLKVIRKEPYEKRIDTGMRLATKENFKSKEIQDFLGPDIYQKN